MRTNIIFLTSVNLRDQLYTPVNNGSKSNVNLGRCLAVPVVLLDSSVDILTTALETIENVAMIAINLVGAAFSKRCSLNDAYLHLKRLVMVPVRLALMPIKLIAQMRNTLKKPDIAMTMDRVLLRRRAEAMAGARV